MHLVWGLPSRYFVSTFPVCRLSFLSGQITIRIDTLRAQLLLEFSTDQFEAMRSTSSVNVHVVLGLSSLYFFFIIFFFYFYDLVFFQV